MAIEYTPEIVEQAVKFLNNLQGFTNKEISQVNDDKPCNDKTRTSIIFELIADEFGDDIFKHLKIKL